VPSKDVDPVAAPVSALDRIDGSVSTRERVFHLLEVEEGDRGFEKALNGALAALIILNIAAVMLETVEDLHVAYARAFAAFEVFSVGVFAAEYLLRLWACTVKPGFTHPVWGRLRYAVSPMALVDLVAILPSLIPGGTVDLRFASGFAASILLVCAACGIYFAEHDAQPKVFSSIPAALWWGVVTLTTVGYGDVYPVTPLGKILSSVIAILGIGLFALPTGILAGGFAADLQRREGPKKCPHCDGDLPN
jgi:voltage-gated potassium channel